MRAAYADPPHPGCAHLYKDHPDYAGEVDHGELLRRLDADYDGWVLHTASTTLADILHIAAEYGIGHRVMAWVKPFAAFKRNVPVAYAWEPVLVKPVRKPTVAGATGTMRDWISEPMTMQRGLTGAKPERVCWWLFDVLGLEAEDELDDLYPGTGAVSRAWESWRANRPLPFEATS